MMEGQTGWEPNGFCKFSSNPQSYSVDWNDSARKTHGEKWSLVYIPFCFPVHLVCLWHFKKKNQIQSFGNACFKQTTSRSWLTWAHNREALAQYWTQYVSIGCHQQMYFTGVWFCSPTSKQLHDLKSKLIDWKKKFEKVSFFKLIAEKYLVF